MLGKSLDGKVFDVANFVVALCNESKISITHLKLQKLLYYVQGWALAIFGKEMFSNDFEAWINGPVCKEVYSKYTPFGFNELIKESGKNNFSPVEIGFITEVVEKYGKLNAWELVALTHKESPWITTRKGLSETDHCNKIISKKLITESFKSRLK